MTQLNSVEHACSRTGLGRTVMYGYIATGELRSIKVGRRRLISDAAIDDFIAYLEEQSDASTAS